jgi:hypothetical protein
MDSPACKICPRCGRQCGEKANFCGGCKYKFTPVPPAPPAASPVISITNIVADKPVSLKPRAADDPVSRFLQTLKFTPATGWSVLAGAGGAWLGFRLSSLIVGPYFTSGLFVRRPLSEMLLEQSLSGVFDCMGVASIILIANNHMSLRGRWDRDLWRGLALFVPLGLMAGFFGQLLYAIFGGSRAAPWALSGAVVGAAIGVLRKDKVQLKQGAIGGAIGGTIGGLLVDGFLSVSYTDETFSLASRIGLVTTGALIGLFMRLVQDSLKTSWLTGTTPGHYLGKEYPLNNERVTVGKSELNDICLYQKSELPIATGAFVKNGSQWTWEGEEVSINGVPQAKALLNSGDMLRFGNTDFRFEARENATA